jgi:hypothetical protein
VLYLLKPVINPAYPIVYAMEVDVAAGQPEQLHVEGPGVDALTMGALHLGQVLEPIHVLLKDDGGAAPPWQPHCTDMGREQAKVCWLDCSLHAGTCDWLLEAGRQPGHRLQASDRSCSASESMKCACAGNVNRAVAETCKIELSITAGALSDIECPPPLDLDLSYKFELTASKVMQVSDLAITGRALAAATQAAGLPTFASAGDAAAMSQVTAAQAAAAPLMLHLRANTLSMVRSTAYLTSCCICCHATMQYCRWSQQHLCCASHGAKRRSPPQHCGAEPPSQQLDHCH